ncbi:MAG: transglycosylase domain-containing protein, partial [Acidimicrobiaceae bacterium]|nr:transglycosylase domain-containing protein [Acidimicrobiaceae bacterium]
MRKLLRLAVLIVVAGALVAGGLTAAAMTTAGVWHHGGTADLAKLAPLGVAASEASTVYAADGKTVLGVFQGSVNRKPVPLSEIPKVLIKAVLDTEDHRFYIHGGFDIRSSLRALASDSSKSGGLQGGSTITQQLVKQLYLNSQQKLSRKIKEAVIADRLQRKYTKNQILEAYLNVIYLGNSAYGVEAAANEYFNEHASQLTLPQAALLAGIIQDPSGYDPLLNPAAAHTRRADVLDHMVQYHDITAAQAKAADATPLPTS